MKQRSLLARTAAMLTISVIVSASSTFNDPSIAGVFSGTTPCGRIIRPLHRIPADIDCALVEWNLTLYQDEITGKPSAFKLGSVSRYVVKETNMYSNAVTDNKVEGTWTITQGIKIDPSAEVYQLSHNQNEISIRFVKLSDDLIHLLDYDGSFMVGDPFFSYTLNRVARP